MEAWAAVKDTSSIAILEEFRRRYPNTPYAAFAAARIDELKALQTAPVVPPTVTPAAPQHPALLAPGPSPAVQSATSVRCKGVPPFSLASRKAAPLSAAEECVLKPEDVFQECAQCPVMVIIPPGSFTMGSQDGQRYERPERVVTIGRAFAVGKFHITVDQFAAFVAETGYNAGSACYVHQTGSRWGNKQGASWRNPGFPQNGLQPAVCTNWYDAKAYVDWLSRKTGKTYRLLTEAEWEYAARAHTQPGAYTRFSFGDDDREMCRHGNGADQTLTSNILGWTTGAAPCNDGYTYTSPVGSFAVNRFGLYDMQGNAFQWTEDCFHDTYVGAPSDGSAWTTGECIGRVERGGSWAHDPNNLRAAIRYNYGPSSRTDYLGFRVARTL